MSIEEKEQNVALLSTPWKALASSAKASCAKSIQGISETSLSENPEWDADFKMTVQQSYEDGYEGLLDKIIECAGRVV